MEGSSLTTFLHYQTFLFCNQRAFTRLVIRRAVEIETLLQLNLWNLGLVWFIVTFHTRPFSKAFIQLQYAPHLFPPASLALAP